MYPYYIRKRLCKDKVKAVRATSENIFLVSQQCWSLTCLLRKYVVFLKLWVSFCTEPLNKIFPVPVWYGWIQLLTHFWRKFPFIPPENSGKALLFWCFQEVQNEKVGQKLGWLNLQIYIILVSLSFILNLN